MNNLLPFAFLYFGGIIIGFLIGYSVNSEKK